MLKSASWLVAAGACLAFAAGPALAADMPATQPAATKPAPKPTMAKPVVAAGTPVKPHHVWTCYDYAWESQAMKDCLNKPAMAKMPMHRHPVMHHKNMMMKGKPVPPPKS